MNRRIRMRIVAVVTTLAWAAMLSDLIPGVDIADEASRLLLTLAGVGSVLMGQWVTSRPAAEVYDLGYESGRRQGRIDAAVSRSGEVVEFRRRNLG